MSSFIVLVPVCNYTFIFVIIFVFVFSTRLEYIQQWGTVTDNFAYHFVPSPFLSTVPSIQMNNKYFLDGEAAGSEMTYAMFIYVTWG